jgi:uncharacterized protein (DUF433 family)
MAKSASARIVTELHDEPHIEGRRVTVRRVQGLVEEAGQSPVEVADELALDIADVYAALHYYHTHPDEMNRTAEQRRRREQDAKEAGAKSIADYDGDDDDATRSG